MSSKTILILGASGLTGNALVQQALDRGHHVIALVRDPAKMTIKSDNLEVVKCNIFDKDELLAHVKKSDVVMSTLGFKLAWSEPVPGYLDISKNVSQCLLEAGKRRAVFMHSWFSEPASIPNCSSWLQRNLLLPYLLGQLLAGMRQAELFLETQEHVDFTCVLPAPLNNGPVTDKPFSTNDTDFYVPGGVADISRANVARYMLDVVDEEDSYRKVRAIAVDGPELSFLGTVKTQVEDARRQN